MGTPYVGEIRMFAGNFPPVGWLFCDGQTLPISENETLFQLIGTTYGGDGEETFNLPNLQSRIPIHSGNGRVLAEMGGAEQVTLTVQQIPVHSHPMVASTDQGSGISPADSVLAAQSNVSVYRPGAANQPLDATAIQPQGGSQPHDNMQPYLCVNFIISLFGIFPQPT